MHLFRDLAFFLTLPLVAAAVDVAVRNVFFLGTRKSAENHTPVGLIFPVRVIKATPPSVGPQLLSSTLFARVLKLPTNVML